MGQGFHGRMGPPKTFIWILPLALRFDKGAEGGIFTFLDHKMSREEKEADIPSFNLKIGKTNENLEKFQEITPLPRKIP